MELLLPLIGVAALGIAALAAACCILIPSPQHLVSRVFFGTFAFLFGGAVLTFVVYVAFALSANAVEPDFNLREAPKRAAFSFIFLLSGAASTWLTLRLLNSLFKSLDARRVKN